MAQGKVAKVSWGFEESCDNANPAPGEETNTLRARIGPHGHFAKTLTYTQYGSDITTSFSGTITATVATVTIKDQEAIPHYGFCHGSHTFHAHKT